MEFIEDLKFRFSMWVWRRRLIKEGTLVKMNSKKGKEMLVKSSMKGEVGKIDGGVRFIETKNL